MKATKMVMTTFGFIASVALAALSLKIWFAVGFGEFTAGMITIPLVWTFNWLFAEARDKMLAWFERKKSRA